MKNVVAMRRASFVDFLRKMLYHIYEVHKLPYLCKKRAFRGIVSEFRESLGKLYHFKEDEV